MRTLAVLLLAVLLSGCRITFAQVLPAHRAIATPTPASGVSETLIKSETFEANEYDAGNTWTEAGGGTIDGNYAGAAKIDGAESLQLSATSASASSELTYTLAQADQYFFFKFTKVGGTSNPLLLAIRNNTTSLGTVTLTATDVLTVQATGGTAASTVATFSDGTVVWVWLHFTQGSGANATLRLWAATSGSKPSSPGNNYAESTDGTSTAQGNRFRLGWTSTSTAEVVADTVKIDDVALGNQ